MFWRGPCQVLKPRFDTHHRGQWTNQADSNAHQCISLIQMNTDTRKNIKSFRGNVTHTRDLKSLDGF
jgi:hypothetical protein